MKNIRIIPRLDIKGPNLVKGIHLEGLRILGKPEDFAEYYYESGADELIYMDIVASLYGRNNLLDIIEKTAKKIFIPLTVGGGIRSLEDIHNILNVGADKVAINTAAIKEPDFIRRSAHRFGSSTIVISIEVSKKEDGTYEAYTDNGREETGLDAFEWAKRVALLGAGEILLTSIDQEGTGSGFDLEFIRKISQLVNIPVIAYGGAGKLEHIYNVINEAWVDAVGVASILHYGFVRDNDMLEHDYSDEGNVEYLKSKRGFSKIQPVSIFDIKLFLNEKSINCRYLKKVHS